MSNKKEREKRREERVQQESKVDSKDRRARLLQFGAGAVFLVIVAVVVLIIASSGGGSGGDTKLEGTADVNKLLAGIPQHGLVLGKPKAPVEVIEYGDLQCPVCKAFSEEVLPQVMENQVKKGEAKLVFRNFTIIGPESTPAGAAALAAGEQERGWTYLELFYRNQGEERSGYAEEKFFGSIAKGAGVKNIAKWEEESTNPKLIKEVEDTTAQANQIGFTGTPSFAIKGPSTNGTELLSNISSSEQLEAEIKKAS
jgi:protein-disulfide isomerase